MEKSEDRQTFVSGRRTGRGLPSQKDKALCYLSRWDCYHLDFVPLLPALEGEDRYCSLSSLTVKTRGRETQAGAAPLPPTPKLLGTDVVLSHGGHQGTGQCDETFLLSVPPIWTML